MTARPTADPEVADDPQAHRYQIVVGGRLAGWAEYARRAGRVTFTHTETAPGFEGQGIGSRLAKAALDDVRARGESAVAQCPFIAGYIERHPEYADLVAP